MTRVSRLVLDFDGTITRQDVGDAVIDRIAPPEWRRADALWARREISLPEAQRQMWALAQATRQQAVAIAREVGLLRPGLGPLLDGAAASGVEVWLASGGFDFYIEGILGETLSRFARAYYNRARFSDDEQRRIDVDFPHAEVACDSCAICKGKVCQLAGAGGARVVFVGDGHSDRCAVGQADVIAAVRGSLLARWCQDKNVHVVEIDHLDEALPLLLSS